MISQGQCNIFKGNLLDGVENFTSTSPYTYKIALYTSLANLTPSTLEYTTSGEITGTGYTAGGEQLYPTTPVVDQGLNTAFLTFANVTWDPAGFTARAALIYNSDTNAAVAVLDFGSDKTNTQAGTFTVVFPTPTATTAIIRLN